MAEVTVTQEAPTPPPKVVTITLTEEEAARLARLLYHHESGRDKLYDRLVGAGITMAPRASVVSASPSCYNVLGK